MCGVIVLVFLLIGALVIQFMGAVAIGVIIIVIGLLASIGNYLNAKEMKPTPMICPNCKSTNVKIQKEVSGVYSNGASSYGGGWGFRTGSHQISRQRIGVCQDCGFDFPYITQDDVNQAIANAKSKEHFWMFLAIVALGIGIWFYYRVILPEKMNSSVSSYDTEYYSEESSKSLIDDFDYHTNYEDTVYLTSYIGHDKIVRLRPSYEIDGVEYSTDISEFGVSNRSAKTLIIDEGFTSVCPTIFNSCDIDKVFFPRSLTCIYDKTLSYLVPYNDNKIKIFYAGTQEEWGNIFTIYQRTPVEDAEMEELGEALADKFNEMLGLGYDSSQFEYYFSASIDDVI